MSAAMELHVALSLRLDATEAYRLAHAYRDEELQKAIRLIDEHPHPSDNPAQFYRELLEGLLSEGEKSSREADATPELTIYRASHDSIVMGLYTTRQAAYEHCEAYEMRDDPVSPMAWNVDEDGVAELVRFRVPRSPGAESTTGYVVTPIEVASEYDEEADE